jgi:hypothetical protein
MRKSRLVAIFLTVAVGVALGQQPRLRAADHADGPAASADPTADITDVFAWMSPDTNDVYLVMDLVRNASADALFSDQVQYVFHTSSRSAFGAAAGPETNVICEFNSLQLVQCWVGTDLYVKGFAKQTSGLSTDDGRLKVFAGPRNDPFFFNLTGFKETAKIVEGAASSLTFDAAGCPKLDAATSAVLVKQLASGVNGAPAKNDFGGFNVLSIAIAVDRTLLVKNGPILSVWASTNRKG